MNNENDIVKKYKYFPDGNIYEESSFLNDKREGERIWYYENGKIKQRGYYKNGKCEGKFIRYYGDGKIKYTVEYINGEPIGLKEFSNNTKNKNNKIKISTSQNKDSKVDKKNLISKILLICIVIIITCFYIFNKNLKDNVEKNYTSIEKSNKEQVLESKVENIKKEEIKEKVIPNIENNLKKEEPKKEVADKTFVKENTNIFKEKDSIINEEKNNLEKSKNEIVIEKKEIEKNNKNTPKNTNKSLTENKKQNLLKISQNLKKINYKKYDTTLGYYISLPEGIFLKNTGTKGKNIKFSSKYDEFNLKVRKEVAKSNNLSLEYQTEVNKSIAKMIIINADISKNTYSIKGKKDNQVIYKYVYYDNKSKEKIIIDFMYPLNFEKEMSSIARRISKSLKKVNR